MCSNVFFPLGLNEAAYRFNGRYLKIDTREISQMGRASDVTMKNRMKEFHHQSTREDKNIQRTFGYGLD